MIAGVRIRLPLTVWKRTVATAIAAPTRASAARRYPRNGRRKLQLPFASIIMKATAERTRRRTSMASRPARLPPGASRDAGSRGRSGVTSRQAAGRGCDCTALAGTARLPEQDGEEERGAEDAEDGADGDLVGILDQAAEEVAGKHEGSSGNGDNGERPAKIVAHRPGHEIGHDEA